MANTTKDAIPYPLGTAAPFVHLDLKAQAEAIDGKLVPVVTTATRPTGAARYVGRPIYDSDTKGFYTWDGTQWVRHVSPQAVEAGAGTTLPPNTAFGVGTPTVSAGGGGATAVLDGLNFATAGYVSLTARFYIPDSRLRAATITHNDGTNTVVVAGPFAGVGGTGFSDRIALTWSGRVIAGSKVTFAQWLEGAGSSVGTTCTISGFHLAS